jgi:predicted nucleic acid-binding protein
VATTERRVLVDSNILLDIYTEDPNWLTWSSRSLAAVANENQLVINPIVYGEVSVRFESIEELEDALPTSFIEREDLPWEAAFLAGKCFMRYRQQGGSKRSPLPDFYIGAHAAVRRMRLLTRDAKKYRAYFSGLELIAPSG